MNESDARKALLVRGFETASPPSVHWNEQDREWASRAAAEVEGEGAPRERFIARRAELAVERLCKRERRVSKMLETLAWRPWVAWLLAAVAFALGLATDAVGTGKQINVLTAPLLALMAWNLLVYALGAVRALAGAFGRRGPGRLSGPLSRLLARAAHLAVSGQGREAVASADQADPGASTSTARVLSGFARDWTRLSTPLNTRRLSRLLHLAAICFALGALAGLYLRGLAFEYRAGWESTFLDAGSLRAWLGFLLGPASALTGIPLPDEARLEAMRFPAFPGEQAGPWIHLQAVTVALVVLLPRAVLAVLDYVRERRLSADFPIPLDEGYFAALERAQRGEAARILVLPYNHEPSPGASRHLEQLLGRALGSELALQLLPPVAYGNEEQAGEALRTAPPLALAAALLAATATPEAETHGRFLESAAKALPPGTPLLVLVDEAAFVARFGNDATARRRRDERRQAWVRLLAEDDRAPVFIELGADDVSAAASSLQKALARLAPAGHAH
jgi:hypothetical protein